MAKKASNEELTRGKCPACGHPGFVARPYPEESKCWHCGAEFYGCDQEVERDGKET